MMYDRNAVGNSSHGLWADECIRYLLSAGSYTDMVCSGGDWALCSQHYSCIVGEELD